MTFLSTRLVCAVGALVMPLSCLPAHAETLMPYQATGAIGDSATCPDSQCIMEFPEVPPRKRLVVDSVSAQLGSVSDLIVLEGGDVSYFVSKSDPDLGYLTVPVTVYYDAGTVPTARVFAPNTGQHTSLIVTLVGHLVRQR